MAKIKKDTSLRKAILQAAITGQLISDVEGETETGKQLLDRIIEERNKKLLAEWEEKLKENQKTKKPTQIVASEIDEEEIPFEIPESWCWCRLGEICTKLVDGDHNPPAGLSIKTEYIMASSQNINDDSLVDLEKVRYLSKEVFEKENERTQAEKGDIFFTSVGTLGRSCVYDGSKNICFQRSVSVLKTEIYNKYLKYCLDAPFIQYFIIDNATGTAQKGFYLNQLAKLVIPLPPLAVQNAIVAKLEEVLPLVDAYENVVLQKEELKNALPDKVKKAILQEAIQGKLTEDWRKTATIEETGKQFLDRIIEERNAKLLAEWEEKLKNNPKAKKPTPIVASEITEEEIPFEIPESWCWCRLGEICNLYNGNSINETEKKMKYTNVKDGWIYVGTKDVEFNQTINYENGVKIPFYNTSFRIAPKNTVLMCIEGGSAGRKIAFTNQDVCFGNKLCCFNPFRNNVEKFLYYFLQSTPFTDAFFNNINGIIGGVSINKIKEMFFPLPPLAEQKKIVEIMEQMLSLCEKLGE